MTIEEIKKQLTLSQVLNYYHLKPDKNLRLHCPFHVDKTPSMQVYYKTHTAYCFSSNCKTHGKSLDVIDFILHKEGLSKHEAILKAKSLITGAVPKQKPMTELTRTAVLTKMFIYFKNGVHNSKPARAYLEKRGLDFSKTEVGYNSGQFHHGNRKEEALIKSCVQVGLLLPLKAKSRTGNAMYKPFGKWCLVFGLKNAEGQVASLYFRSTLSDKKNRHFYLRDRQGLYPGYPKSNTKILILTESIIDAATLLEVEAIKYQYGVLALYGTNGWTDEHEAAVKSLQGLEEIIFFLNGDAPGREAGNKYGEMLKTTYPKVKLTVVEVPDNEDVNSLAQGHVVGEARNPDRSIGNKEILLHLIEGRKAYKKEVLITPLLFSTEISTENKNTPAVDEKEMMMPRIKSKLNTSNPMNLKYAGRAASYEIKGFKINQLDSLKITLNIAIK